MSIALQVKVDELERRVAALEAAQTTGQVQKDQAEIKVPAEIARATLTLPEKRKSA